jgi:hypothetical protein
VCEAIIVAQGHNVDSGLRALIRFAVSKRDAEVGHANQAQERFAHSWRRCSLVENGRAYREPAAILETPRPSRSEAEAAVRALIAYIGDDPDAGR